MCLNLAMLCLALVLTSQRRAYDVLHEVHSFTATSFFVD